MTQTLRRLSFLWWTLLGFRSRRDFLGGCADGLFLVVSDLWRFPCASCRNLSIRAWNNPRESSSRLGPDQEVNGSVVSGTQPGAGRVLSSSDWGS